MLNSSRHNIWLGSGNNVFVWIQPPNILGIASKIGSPFYFVHQISATGWEFVNNLIVFITWNFSGCRANKFCLNCRFSLADGENGRLARETATQEESAQWAKQQRAGSPKPLLCNLLTLSALSQTSRLEFMKRRRRNALQGPTFFFTTPPFLDRGNPLMVCSAETRDRGEKKRRQIFGEELFGCSL